MKNQAIFAYVMIAMVAGASSVCAKGQEPTMKFSKALESDITVSNVRTLSDGNSLSSLRKLKFYRDSDGSTRLEAGDRVTIIDRTSRKLYVLNLENRTAQEIDQPPASIPNRVTAKRQIPLESLGNSIDLPTDGFAPAKKALPSVTIEGFVAKGEETTSTTPAHSAAGNERPLTRTVQTWRSRELNLPLKMVISDPVGGTTTSTYQNIKVESALDRSLFSIPPGFIVRYGTQSRVIHPQAQ